ncbi:hypothetical protein Leryth_020033 [Lithospermum erythrorhizon]|nr:hypothetical protein Leryth_020033 [Lithospermum erythrorhizon]
MKEREDNIDLSLSLGDSTQFVEPGRKSNEGVGANAESKINMAFAASDPLSELVWSPKKGLSLRCADSTFAATKPLLLWNVGPSNLVLSLPENIRTREDDDHKSGGEEHFIVAHVESPVNQNLDKEICLATFSQRMASPINSRNQIENVGNDMMDVPPESNVMQHHPDDEANNIQNTIIPGETAIGEYNAGTYQVDQRNNHFLTQDSSNCKVDLSLSEPSPNKLHDEDIPRPFEVQCRLQNEPVSPLQCTSHQQGAEKATPDTKQESENKVRNDNSLAGGAPLKSMESAAEINLPLVMTEAPEQTTEKHERVNSNLLKPSPTRSWMDLYQKKGKGKVVYDGDVSVRLSDDVEYSHESVESCNSSGFSAKGKKRLNPAESTIDSKRAKTEPKDKPAFSLPIRHNNSFMSWISNMVKGYRDDPSFNLRLDHPDLQKDDVRDIVACSKRSDDGYIGTGFHAMFQSLYSTASRKPDPLVSEAEYMDEGSEHLVLANSRPRNIPALAYLSEKDKCFERSLSAKENTDAPTSGNLVRTRELQIVPANAALLDEVRETNSGSDKDGSGFIGCLTKQRNSTTYKIGPNLLSENKTVNNISEKKSTLGSLWITRFCAKNVSASLNLDKRNQNENRDATDLSRFNYIQVGPEVHTTRNSLGIWENRNEKVGNDLQNDLEVLSVNLEESSAHKEILGHNHQNSFHNLDIILPSTICKSPDEIASIFARRLDALKQISLSDTKGGTSSQMTCLFCGKYGHELRYCSDTTESELEALLCNVSSHASALGSSFCIICFQLDHWANTCPQKSTRRTQILDTNNSIGNLNVKLCEGDEQDSTFLTKCKGDPLHDTNLNLPSSKSPLVYPETDNITRTIMDSDGRRISGGNEVRKCIGSKFREHVSRRRQCFPISNLVGKQIEAVPGGMLDAIKRLRLSRVEILKCMNSRVSLSYLNGFFIRLRIGKLESGQGGTGYYVASITAKNSKKYIAVNVGGTQSLVGIQYVSNHDFLEDELVTWWCRTLETGAKVPSQGELKSKFEERMKLGFC